MNGLGRYEVMVSSGVIGEGNFEEFGERCCECQTHFVVKVDGSHFVEGVVVY